MSTKHSRAIVSIDLSPRIATLKCDTIWKGEKTCEHTINSFGTEQIITIHDKYTDDNSGDDCGDGDNSEDDETKKSSIVYIIIHVASIDLEASHNNNNNTSLIIA